MAASSGSSRGGSWPDLPSELLGLVLSRLPSHADRVRLAAVCRSWRSNARLLRPLPSLLPWLALCDGTFLSLPDGAVHRMPVANDVSSRVSTGSELFLVHGNNYKCPVSLMDPSSATMTTPVPELADWFRGKSRDVRKVVMSDQLIAALIDKKLFYSNRSTYVIISTRQPQGDDCTMRSTTSWSWKQPAGSAIKDIAIFKGKLYVLTTKVETNRQELHILEDGHEKTTICSSIPINDSDHDDYEEEEEVEEDASLDLYRGIWYKERNYLVVSAGRLLMVKRTIRTPPVDDKTCKFEVFEAAELSSGSGRWRKVNSLMGHALFLSQGCSKSLQCCGTGVQEDCIYFINEEVYVDCRISKRNYENPFLDSGVYNMRDQTITALVSDTTVTPQISDGPWPPTWFFPRT